MKFLVPFIMMFVGSVSMAQEQFDLKKYIHASMEGLLIQNEAHMNTWGIGKGGTWNVEQDKGKIVWILPTGMIAEAPVQILGTYNPIDGSFLWAWDHPSILEPLRMHANLVREFGEKYGIQTYTDRKVQVTEDEAWEFVAVANRLADANGGYRAEAGGPIVFMTFGEITLQKNEN